MDVRSSRSTLFGLGFFSLGYFVSEAVRIYLRKRKPPKAITASVCDEWTLTLETARELDEAGGGARRGALPRDAQASRLAELAAMALATVSETARAVRELGARGDDAADLTRLCATALETVSLSARRIAANAATPPRRRRRPPADEDPLEPSTEKLIASLHDRVSEDLSESLGPPDGRASPDVWAWTVQELGHDDDGAHAAVDVDASA
jgi:hypothetical protein